MQARAGTQLSDCYNITTQPSQATIGPASSIMSSSWSGLFKDGIYPCITQYLISVKHSDYNFFFVYYSIGKVRLDTALELSLYLSKETEVMAVTQGFGELVPLYKLMEKRDMTVLENQMKVSEGHGCLIYQFALKLH